MSEWLTSALAGLAGSPPLQGVVAALSTFVLEDPTTIGCGLLVAENKMGFMTALLGVAIGIAVGDVGLYGIGRVAGPRVRGWGPLTPERLDRGSRWFERNMVSAVLLSRFVPGMRLPTYVAAGLLRAPWWRFTVVVIGASLVWTFLLLSLTVAVGERVLPLLGRYRWPVALAAVVILVVFQRRAARSLARSSEKIRVTSYFELWPPWFFYIPVLLYWFWLALRYRGLLLPTAANPSIYTGGFIGESKREILDLVPAEQQRWVARYTTVVRDRPEETLRLASGAMTEAGLGFPVVAKPDVGQRGDGVRPIADAGELAEYLADFPVGSAFVLQELVPADGDGREQGVREAGVLYWRMPGSERGSVSSITLKTSPQVVGDGVSTLRQLIEADPRARLMRRIYFRRHLHELDRVLDAGQRFSLVFAGNHCQGAIFKNGTALLTGELEDRIDEIARSIPGFYFGRFDLRFSELESFLKGEGFKIIEINGASAEATHIWDASVRLLDAYATLFSQYRTVFVIGAANRERGHQPIGLLHFLRELMAYRRLARSYPMTG